MIRPLALACVLTLGGIAPPAAAGTVEPPARWLQHLEEDLLGFWSAPGAEGTPPGSFPGRLCNDGTLPEPGVACDGVTAWQARKPRQTLVAQSRQVFSYAVAFHMTGERRWLDLARAGAAYQFDTFLDPDTGLFDEIHDPATGASRVGGAGANSQKQAYGLLGPTFLHYLTGDAALGARIDGVAQALDATFRTATGGYRARPGDSGPSDTIVHHLDQLNAWQTLLASQAPLADRAGLTERALQTARHLREAFHDPVTGLFRRRASDPEGSLANADFGHSVKALWFIDQTAKLAGDAALQRFAQDQAQALFARAWRPDQGAWSTGLDAEGAPDDRAVWWSFAELDQFAAALAIADPDLRDAVAAAQDYWLTRFVDADHGGIWGGVDLATGAPDTGYPKHWEWKAGFHGFEHALISYLAASATEDGVAELFFARADDLPETLAYGFLFDDAETAPASTLVAGDEVRRVTYSGLTYAAAPLPAVPVPPGMALILLAFGLVWLLRRR